MSDFSERMINEGFDDPQDFMDHLCSEAVNNGDPSYFVEYFNDEVEDEEY